jgi:hypothetical protein
MIGLDARLVLDLDDRHRRATREYLRKAAVLVGRQVLDDHESQSGAGRQRTQQLAVGLEPAG